MKLTQSKLRQLVIEEMFLIEAIQGKHELMPDEVQQDKDSCSNNDISDFMLQEMHHPRLLRCLIDDQYADRHIQKLMLINSKVL